MVIDFSAYKNDGWGLSNREFELLHQEITLRGVPFLNMKQIMNVVEFGSGVSTQFLLDLIDRYKLSMQIHSFDDSAEYAYKKTHPKLKLHIVPLVECDDATFEGMFVNKVYDATKMHDKITPLHTRQKNTFYKMDELMLPESIDLLIVDGPHGNGRSMAYLHCFNRLHNGSLVLIDDASHYPFYDHLTMLHDTRILSEQHIRENKWENGGDFIFCEIVK